MKQLRRALSTIILTLAFAVSTFGGHMATGVASPPPDPTVSATGHMATGVISTGDSSGSETTSGNGESILAVDPVTEIALTLFQSLLSLF
jgi:hypothetical protein